jgi:hypothetical protein
MQFNPVAWVERIGNRPTPKVNLIESTLFVRQGQPGEVKKVMKEE